MKHLLWTTSGLAVAVIAWSILNRNQQDGPHRIHRGDTSDVDRLAGQLQRAWADHHTAS